MGGVVNAAAYADGRKVRDIAIEEIGAVLSDPDRFVWIGVQEPDEALLRALQQAFGLHDLAVEDALCAHQRPKLEEYGDSLFVVLRTAQLERDGDRRVAFGETHIFVGPRYILTVRHGPSLSYAEVRQRCESTPSLLRKGPGFVLYAIMDFVVDHYFPIVDALEANLSLIAVRQNEVMKQLGAWGAIIAVPTLIAGVYGMNFEFMPELHWRWAYPMVGGLMVAASVALYVRFKRSGWI